MQFCCCDLDTIRSERLVKTNKRGRMAHQLHICLYVSSRLRGLISKVNEVHRQAKPRQVKTNKRGRIVQESVHGERWVILSFCQLDCSFVSVSTFEIKILLLRKKKKRKEKRQFKSLQFAIPFINDRPLEDCVSNERNLNSNVHLNYIRPLQHV